MISVSSLILPYRINIHCGVISSAMFVITSLLLVENVQLMHMYSQVKEYSITIRIHFTSFNRPYSNNDVYFLRGLFEYFNRPTDFSQRIMHTDNGIPTQPHYHSIHHDFNALSNPDKNTRSIQFILISTTYVISSGVW